MRFVGWRLPDSKAHCFGTRCGVVGIGVKEVYLHSGTAGWIFWQKVQEWMCGICRVRVELEHLLTVCQDGEISRSLKGTHSKQRAKTFDVRQHIAYQ